MTFERFTPFRPLAEYVGQAGHEFGGQMLSSAAYEALGASKTRRQPPEYVVTGQMTYPDGRRYLVLGVNYAYIEATTDWRRRIHEDGTMDSKLTYRCPDCGHWAGKHARTCGL